MAANPGTVPGLLSVLRLAISDPGSQVERRRFGLGPGEHPEHWAARAAEKAVAPMILKAAARHDPAVNCNCEPNDALNAGVCEYRLLADSVGDAFNPPDDDSGEVAILIGAVERARDALAAIPCSCTPEMIADWDQCPRCAALGQRAGKVVQR